MKYPSFPLLLWLFLTPCLSSAQTDPNPAKTRALELRTLLISACENGDPTPEAWDGVRAQIDNYQKEFGVTPATSNNILLLRKQELGLARRFTDPSRYRSLLDQLAEDSLPAVAELARQQLASLQRLEDLKTKPMELQFTAVDGSPVDLSRLRGKVVLIDFWATWCPPCVEGIPGLIEIYKKYHAQGLEVIGISLDSNQEQMLAFTRKNRIEWPQYFDGKKWENEISRSYGISSIPAIWLLDRKGMLVTRKAGEDLAAQVETLLQAP